MLPARPSALLESRIAKALASEADAAQTLLRLWAQLPHSQRRLAAQQLSSARTWAAHSDESFWRAFCALSTADARTHLGTLLKAACERHRQQGLSFQHAVLHHWACEQASPIDRRKLLDALLPLQSTPEAALALLSALHFSAESLSTQAATLFRAATPSAYFLLVRVLQQLEDNRPLLRRYALEFMRRGDATAFAVASLMAHLFRLDPLPGRLSLQLEDYQLDAAVQQFPLFCKLLHIDPSA